MGATFLANLGSPPLLCFFLGASAAFARSDLDVPNQVAKALSLYLLFAIGFKGGVALAHSSLSFTVVATLLAALLLAAATPVLVFVVVRKLLSKEDAAAVAATYGSISAVTFVTATSYLDGANISWNGHLVAAMALMEAPAIAVGLFLYQRVRNGQDPQEALSGRELARESLLNGSVLLVLGSLLIGWVSGDKGMAQLEPFIKSPFIGVLCLFLLDMGLVAARRLEDILKRTRQNSPSAGPVALCGLGIAFALGNGLLAAVLATLLGLPEGDALLLTILGASASYIAVPAAMRLALPEANPGIYLTMALAVTFPFNILVGIPLFHGLVRTLAGT